ncbi:zinc finger and SCAN domain-containing protein 2-like [Trifolium medium]|uniref:Zinc finger and SCAN domain-containing protein 2-like n=1 Tax=Trifolium medium TaxID=97028 RepID=A0A392NZP8_9FABA|nr:zinc finger and SCAN domain-containing protein 2-like [Trifolium medium]
MPESKIYEQGRSLKIHYLIKDMFHVCFECGRTFKTLQGLHIHESSHSKARCDQCGEIFSSPQACGRHRNTHRIIEYHPPPHPPIPEIPFQCNYCASKFSTAEELDNHVANRH